MTITLADLEIIAADVATRIIAIPNPSHMVVKAQVQMLANTYVAELKHKDKRLRALAALASQLLYAASNPGTYSSRALGELKLHLTELNETTTDEKI